jgi:hypothetical protein
MPEISRAFSLPAAAAGDSRAPKTANQDINLNSDSQTEAPCCESVSQQNFEFSPVQAGY